MEYSNDFGMAEHPKVPGKYYITRSGKKFTPTGKKTCYLSQQQAHATILDIIKEINERASKDKPRIE